MKKYLFTMVVMAVFAIGFAASDEEEKSSNEVAAKESSSESKTETEEIKKEEPKDFFEKGCKYETGSYRVVDFNYSYALTYYNDGTAELTKYCKCVTGEYNDETEVFECKITKHEESKRDVLKKWYGISGKKKGSNLVIHLLVDEQGRGIEIAMLDTKDGYDYIGEKYDFTFRKK